VLEDPQTPVSLQRVGTFFRSFDVMAAERNPKTGVGLLVNGGVDTRQIHALLPVNVLRAFETDGSMFRDRYKEKITRRWTDPVSSMSTKRSSTRASN
jgi:hypothetical protein